MFSNDWRRAARIRAAVIIREGGCGAAIWDDEPSAAYTGRYLSRGEWPASVEAGRSVRVVVEVMLAFGGMTMRALLGAQFTVDPLTTVTAFEVPFGEPLGWGSVADCHSELGPPLTAGLPSDFAEAALAGLTGDAEAHPFPCGLLRVDRAGFDEIGSSEMAFKLAGDLLGHVLRAMLRNDDPLAAARAVVHGW